MPACYNISIEELNERLSQGWILRGGPFNSEEECLNNCSSSSTGSGGSEACAGDLWQDFFTDANGTNLAIHVPEVGAGYNDFSGILEIIGNQVQTVDTSAVYDFDPGSTNTIATIDFNFVDTSTTDLKHVYLSQRWVGTGNNRFLAGVGRVSGEWKVLVSKAPAGTPLDMQDVVINENTWYTLTVTNNGNTITANANGVTATVIDSTDSGETAMALEIAPGPNGGTGTILLDNLCVNEA